ncbi:MAG: 4Fe-4S binding protein [Thermincola sp.]|nr:4Fe-4S binding protein [Thermincola sp.]MDT3703563.1 4Fe-4S binding protein [Thermincola sp.]
MAQILEVVNPYEIDTVMSVLKNCMASGEPSVVIARYPCVLNIKEKHPVPTVDPEICTNCGTCLKIGCPPLIKTSEHVVIDNVLCNGCGFCARVCPFDAIKKPGGPFVRRKLFFATPFFGFKPSRIILAFCRKYVLFIL